MSSSMKHTIVMAPNISNNLHWLKGMGSNGLWLENKAVHQAVSNESRVQMVQMK